MSATGTVCVIQNMSISPLQPAACLLLRRLTLRSPLVLYICTCVHYKHRCEFSHFHFSPYFAAYEKENMLRSVCADGIHFNEHDMQNRYTENKNTNAPKKKKMRNTKQFAQFRSASHHTNHAIERIPRLNNMTHTKRHIYPTTRKDGNLAH